MDISQHNGLPIRFILLECCGSCDFYKRKRVSGALRRKKAKIGKEF